MKALDLKKLPLISDIRSILKYDPFKEFPELIDHGDVSERIYGCGIFNGGQKDKKYTFFSEKAHLRAALGEFVSISEMLKMNDPDLTIESSDIPLLHFFKELRVTNFHLRSISPNTIKDKYVMCDKSSSTTDSEEFEIESFIISDCNISLFSQNNNYLRNYNSTEFRETIYWVAEQQKIWGITYIIELALRQYCEIIKNKYYP